MHQILLALAAIYLTRQPMIGITPNVTSNGGGDELVKNLLWCREHRLTLLHMAVNWNDIESSVGFNKVVKDISDAAKFGFTPIVTIETINTVKREVPADLMTEAWDSPKMRFRFDTLLAKFVRALPENYSLISLGNEVDAYLSIRSVEVGPYISFLSEGRRLIHQMRPGMKVGITTTFDGLRFRPLLVDKLQQGMDVFCETYYPLNPDWTVRSVHEVKPDMNLTYQSAKGRPVYFQEAGYPASEAIGSSEPKQADFVDAVFTQARYHSAQTFGVIFFILTDFSAAMMDTFAKYYAVDSSNFRACFGSLGFRSSVGRDKLAVSHLVQQMNGSWGATLLSNN